jgi:hypothetical protein
VAGTLNARKVAHMVALRCVLDRHPLPSASIIRRYTTWNEAPASRAPMRETRSYGTVGAEDGNTLAYPAIRLLARTLW